MKSFKICEGIQEIARRQGKSKERRYRHCVSNGSKASSNQRKKRAKKDGTLREKSLGSTVYRDEMTKGENKAS